MNRPDHPGARLGPRGGHSRSLGQMQLIALEVVRNGEEKTDGHCTLYWRAQSMSFKRPQTVQLGSKSSLINKQNKRIIVRVY